MNEAAEIFAPRRVLVTGGAGFIGSHLVDRLLADASVEQLVVLDALTYAGRREHLAEAERDPRTVFVHGDITDLPLVARLFSVHDFDTVFHLAAESHVDRSIEGALPFARTNVVGTVTLLEAARAAWRDDARRRFLHVSTDEVYGALGPVDAHDAPGAKAAFDESSPYDPTSPYAASKAASDHFARAFFKTYRLPVIVTHCANNYGPRQATEKFIPRLITAAMHNRPLPVFGQGKESREWLYVGDHCDALLRAIARGRPGETYDFPGHDQRPNLATAEAIADRVDALRGQPLGTSRRMIAFVENRRAHDFRYAIDGRKARAELEFEPKTTWDDGLSRTVAWYLGQVC